MLIFGIMSIRPRDFEVEVNTTVVVNTLNVYLAVNVFHLIGVCQSRYMTFFNESPRFAVFCWSSRNSMAIDTFNFIAEK